MRVNFLTLLIFFGALLIILFPLLNNSFYESHDGEAHVARINAYYHAFLDGQFPPRWAGNLNFTYGSPIFLFYYPLPGYLGALIHAFGISLENSFKLLIALIYIGSAASMFLWARQLFKKETAFLATFLYILLPYHILNLYVRGDIAELLALAFIPLTFYSIEKIVKTQKWFYVSLGALSYGFLILSHNGISLLFSPIILMYMLIRVRGKKALLQCFVILILGLLVSSYFWFPALSESQYTNAHLFIKDMYKNHFPSFLQLIYSPWAFGADVAKPNGLSPQIGPISVLFVILGVYFFVKKKSKNINLGFWLAVFFIAVFMSLSISTPLWAYIPILRLFEFPWRFTAVSSFAAVLVAGYVLDRFDKKTGPKTSLALVIIMLALAIPMLKVNKYVARSDNFYQKYTGTTDYHGAASTIWTAGDPGKLPKAPAEIIEGEGRIQNYKKKSQIHEYVVNAKYDIRILENTIFYPGWLVKVDNVLTNVEFQDYHYRGLITFRVPKGKHNVKVFFVEPRNRKIANLISVAAFMVVIFIGVISKIKYIKR